MNTMLDEITEETIWIPAGESQLEGILSYPEDVTPREAALLLAPHPHLGGRMDNNVITHLARRLASEGWATLRFNYGGVGASTLRLDPKDTPYEYWDRLEASQNYRAVLPDVVAARRYLCETLPELALTCVGYSFGACMALLLTEQFPPARLVAVSPPVSRAPLEGVDTLAVPSLFIAGDRDFAFDAARFEPILARVPGPATFVSLAGSDHFFRREESRVYDVMTAWLDSQMEEGAP